MTIALFEPMLSDFKEGTLAHVIQRVIEDIAAQPDLKQPGTSQRYTLRLLQRVAMGKKIAAELTEQDYVDHAMTRRKKVKAATVQQDFTFLRGALKYARSRWKDCRGLSAALTEFDASKPFLQKQGLMGKAAPRKRVPIGDEIERLKALARERAKNPRTVVKRMDDVIEFAVWSSRRMSEITRITWGDADFERGMYCVRDLKHPTKKKGNDKWFPMLGPIRDILQRQPRINPNDPNERFFPYNKQTCVSIYVELKKKLGITGLRFHDNRRKAITHWLAVFKSPHVVKQISGHDTIQILERNYDASDPAKLHEIYAQILAQQVPSTTPS